MNRKLTIALVAHDNRKADMVEWAVHNAEFLSHHLLVCTGTTGGLVRKEVDLAVFLIDDLNAQPHEADIQMLLRQCRVHNVPIACNRYSADLMITSTLWDDDSYVPMEPKYVLFKRD